MSTTTAAPKLGGSPPSTRQTASRPPADATKATTANSRSGAVPDAASTAPAYSAASKCSRRPLSATLAGQQGAPAELSASRRRSRPARRREATDTGLGPKRYFAPATRAPPRALGSEYDRHRQAVDRTAF